MEAKMVTMSLTWSLSALISSAKPPRVNRYSGVSMASARANLNTVKVSQGFGNLPKIDLTCVHGSEAEVYLFGGCVTSWKVASKDLLFVRPDAVFNGKKPISGGVPHCFPQFGPGPIQQHGFARNVNWSLVNSEDVEGNPVITLELKDSPYSRSMWDYSFQALYKVTLDRNTLSTELRISNTDEKPFAFTTALHTYFRASVTGASVTGLKGCKTLNKYPDPKIPVEGMEERDVVAFPGFIDCIYLDAPVELQLDNGLGDQITIKNTNWSDTVLWNPHLTMESCYKDFVCVENAKVHAQISRRRTRTFRPRNRKNLSQETQRARTIMADNNNKLIPPMLDLDSIPIMRNHNPPTDRSTSSILHPDVEVESY